jgi:hypothetical protein
VCPRGKGIHLNAKEGPVSDRALPSGVSEGT